jgi:hypothetical protein
MRTSSLLYTDKLVVNDSKRNNCGLFNYMPRFSCKYSRILKRASSDLLIRPTN